MPTLEPKCIELNGSEWTNVIDLYKAIFVTIHSPVWHCTSPDALNDSMVFGGINGLNPPYDLVVTNLREKSIAHHIDIIREMLAHGRANFRETYGHDVEVSLRMEGQSLVR